MANKPQEDIIKSRGIGLRVSEWREVDKIAHELGLSTHALVVYIIKRFVKDYHQGKIKLETRKSLPDL